MPTSGLEALSEDCALLDRDRDFQSESLAGATVPPSSPAPRPAPFRGVVLAVALASAAAALCAAGALAAHRLGTVAAASLVQAQAASEHGTPVFEREDGGPCFRIPAVVSLPSSGRFVAFAEARFDDDCRDAFSKRIAVSFSDDAGATWSEPSYVAGSDAIPVSNPYPIALQSGKVVLIFAKHSLENFRIVEGIGMVASTDGGETWGAEADVSADFGPAAGAQPGPGAGVALQMGDITGTGATERLLVVSHKGANENDFITYSDDEGLTWRTIGHTFPAMDEAALADLGHGEVMLVMRHGEMVDRGRAVSRSSDYGMTWTDIEFTDQLPHAKCQGSILHHMGTGATYFAAPLDNDPEAFFMRSNIVLRKSTDGGFSWGQEKEIYMDKTNGYTSLVYIDMMTAGEGWGVGVLYETFGGIFFAVVQS